MTFNAGLTADQITIAVTVFNRRTYVLQAIESALNQTAPVRVIVVEDCGPDPALEEFVKSRFGSRIHYFRNARRRGIFGNWNACMDLCKTEWLSILHDDDYLAPNFIEAMLDLHRQIPDCGLYFGQTMIVDHLGEPLPQPTTLAFSSPSKRVQLTDVLFITPFPFPGHIFRTQNARDQGGFRESSLYCGDWEMWSRLIAFYGGAQTSLIVAFNRGHAGPERGTSQIYRTGRLYPLTFVQRKRNLRLLRNAGTQMPFDRRQGPDGLQIPTRMLLCHGTTMSPRVLRYNVKLFLLSSPPHPGYALFQLGARLFGVPFVKIASRVWTWVRSSSLQRNANKH